MSTANQEIELITATARPRAYWSAHKALYALNENLERWKQAGLSHPPAVGEVSIAPRPWSLEVYPTMACQIACVHCYAQERNEEYRFASMPLNMMERLHASIERMGIRGIQYCGGGEPLLWRRGGIADFIATLPRAVTRAGMASNLMNGNALARPDVLERMVFLEVAVFAYDETTYEIVSQRKGAYRKLVEGLQAIFRARSDAGLSSPSINAKILINSLNYRWLPEIYNWAESQGFDNIHLRLVDDYENLGSFTLNATERQEFRSLLKGFAEARGLTNLLDNIDLIMGAKGVAESHHHCWTVALGLNVWVLANGEVYVCGPQWGKKDFCIGSLQYADLDELWGSERHRAVAKRLIDAMGTSHCYAMGCRHIKQTLVIDEFLAGNVQSPAPTEFGERHAWFL